MEDQYEDPHYFLDPYDCNLLVDALRSFVDKRPAYSDRLRLVLVGLLEVKEDAQDWFMAAVVWCEYDKQAVNWALSDYAVERPRLHGILRDLANRLGFAKWFDSSFSRAYARKEAF